MNVIEWCSVHLTVVKIATMAEETLIKNGANVKEAMPENTRLTEIL